MLDFEVGSVASFDCGCEYKSKEVTLASDGPEGETFIVWEQTAVCEKSQKPPYIGFLYNSWASTFDRANAWLSGQVAETH